MPQKIFIQAILNAGYISEPELTAVFDSINAKLPQESRKSIETIINEANETFQLLNLEFVKFRNEFDNDKFYYMIIDKKPEPSFVDKLAMPSTHAVELKDLLAKMLETADCQGVDIRELGGASAKQAIYDEVISHMLKNDWLVKLDRNRVFISPKMVHELEEYFESDFSNTLLRCSGCNEWFLSGKICSNSGCRFRLHNRCYEAYFRARNKPLGECPQCHQLI